MLANSLRHHNKTLLQVANQNFAVALGRGAPSIIHRVFNKVDSGTTAFSMNKFDPTVPLQGHKPLFTNEVQAEYNVTSLNNGFTVLTENQTFPGAVNMGFFINVGTRDETEETSGSLLALKNTYLKTLKHTNETINYGMIQMSGGDMQMDYDQESMYFRGHCIEYDTIDMFQMMVDIALEPRSVLAANVAKSKNQKSHDLAHHLHKYDPNSNNQELLLRTAFGYKTLGMPRLGLEGNVGYLDARVLQQFIMDNITPKKCLIVASGIKNHKEYVDLVKERLGDMLAVPEHDYVREASQYIGGEYRTWTESPTTNIQVAFESVPWAHTDVLAFNLINQMVGSAKAFGKSNHGRSSYVVQNNEFVDSIHGINSHFSDTGLFGISVEGAGSHSADLLKVAIDQLNKLREPISEQELSRAKNTLKMNFLLEIENSSNRLEELARNFSSHGNLTIGQYSEQIDAITGDQINQAARRALHGKPTMVVTGGAINMVPSMTDVQRQLN